MISKSAIFVPETSDRRKPKCRMLRFVALLISIHGVGAYSIDRRIDREL